MKEQIEKIQRDMVQKMEESQNDLVAKMTQLLKGVDKGKGPVIVSEEENNGEPLYPPGFTPRMHNLIECIAETLCESLTGAASKWYNQLSRAKIATWRDLAQAFLRQYNHVSEMMPDRITLQNLGKKSNESFRQYAQRWREVAVQVQPPLLEKEMTTLFINTLKAPFITHMSITVNQPKKVVANQQGSSRQELGARQTTEKPQFTPIPMSYKELYQTLFDAHVVAPRYLSPLQPPYPKWYDTNAQCDYHAGISGHLIENCTAFKKVVEGLIKLGVVKLDDSPNAKNPLPNHADKGVNMVSEGTGEEVKTDIAEVKTPLKRVWKEIAKRGLVISDSEEGHEMGNYCEFHHKTGHEIQECEGFKALVQSMMDNKEMRFYEDAKEMRSICATELGTKAPKINHPMVIISRPKGNEVRAQVTPKIVIQKPSNFSYRDNKMVPWNYGCNVTILGKEAERNQEIGSYTRNGKRHDAQAESSREENWKKEQRKGKAVEVEPLVNEPIKEEEAKEFLKFLKHSEYSVLNETYVADDISVNKLDRLINNIGADNFIFFNDDEIPSGGRCSTKALHVTVRCKGYTLPEALVDNGSALNVLPLSTLSRLPIDSSHMKACQSIVRAFDGTKKEVMGRIEVPLRIGPVTYEVDFLVMDIKLSYNCLLGRPWIHSAGAVPSSLHQKVKLVSEDRLVTIDAEEDIIAMMTSDAPYVDINDEALECSFRSLEFVNAMFIAEGNRIPVPKISRTTEMGLRLMVGRGALPGKGLGKYLQGRIEAPMPKEKFDRFGLGYKPDMKQKKKEVEKRQEKRRARLNGHEAKCEPLTFPHISTSFVSGGFIHSECGVSGSGMGGMLENVYTNAIEATERRALLEICPYEPRSKLNNWTAEEIPVVFRAYSESSDINDMSDAASNAEPIFEQEVCLEGSHDFENDEDYDASPDLLRMVEQEDKHILPHRESLEIVSLDDGKEVKIGTEITAKTRQDLINLLR
ncbi:uncharacterized protein LOC128041902 [Gossypium raimondii]|uniref:uncharacterized protein LOC128041902 n=1 Tax=Gossypium raimondii TaxID=29730 RepID=UPI00227D38DA|nr:uncharacterized protein LOC128041902 [Gossypium raimondii]